MTNNNNIILGGAQFGMDYGSSIFSKRVNFKNLSKILNFAHKNKINSIDTAAAYGISEKQIGFYLFKNRKKKFKIFSKIPKIHEIKKKNLETIKSLIEESTDKTLRLLKVPCLDGLAIHNCDDFFKKKKIFLNCIRYLKKKGKIKSFGISIYNPSELKKAYKIKEVNFIQMPINILDHRWDERELIKIKKKGIKIFARSIFLRGFLFFKENQKWSIPNKEKMEIEKNLKYVIKRFSMKNIIEITFAFLNSMKFLSGIVCGFNSITQLKQIKKYLHVKKLTSSQKKFLKNKFYFVSKKILDGRNY